MVNMLVHADYLDSETAIRAEVHDFFYTFTNPGTMKIPQEQLRSGNAITEPTVFIRMAREKIDSNAEEDGIIADIGEMNENDG